MHSPEVAVNAGIFFFILSVFVDSCSCVELHVLLVPVGANLLGMRMCLSGSHTGKYPRNLLRLSSNGELVANGLALYTFDIEKMQKNMFLQSGIVITFH